MTTEDTQLSQLIINTLTKEQYDALVTAGTIDNNALYFTTDESFYNKAQIDLLLNNKQNTLTAGTGISIDTATNTISSTSSAIWGNITGTLSNQTDLQTALNAKQNTLTFDTTPTINSTNPVTSGGIYTALETKQNTLTFDTAPTLNSTNPVTSGGIYTALADKADINLSNITDTGKQVIKDNSGAGLEICDIGMTLYVDETKGLRRYLNGQLVAINTQTTPFLNRLKSIVALYPSLSTNETSWQATKTLSAYGQVGKFVIDETAGTIRIPAIVNVQGLFDLANLGLTVSAGLPNITGEATLGDGTRTGLVNTDGTVSGAFKRGTGSASSHFNSGGTGGSSSNALAIDASLSSSIYGNSTTVQPESVQYPYFIQIATGQETKSDIINTLELNNPYTLFDSKYSENILYNSSWLRSQGQYNSGTVYVTAYEALQIEYNTAITIGTTSTLPSGSSYTKKGLSVKLSTETFTDYDYVLNTTDSTFRLPIENKLASGNAVKGNGMTLGLTDGTRNFGLITNVGNAGGRFYLGQSNNAYGSIEGQASGANSYDNPDTTAGITTDPTKSGIVTDNSNLYLYYYIGETVQNASLINAGRIEETKANIDLGNINASTTAKNTIVSWGMPDYSAGVEVTREVWHTVSKDSFVYGGAVCQAGVVYYLYVKDSQGNDIPSSFTNTSGILTQFQPNGAAGGVCSGVVPNGYSYKFAGGNSLQKAIECPLKGVE
jgi:hypothetical protein